MTHLVPRHARAVQRTLSPLSSQEQTDLRRILGKLRLPALLGLCQGALRGGRERRFPFFVSGAISHARFHLFQVCANSYIDSG